MIHKAHYQPLNQPSMYRGNPLIEALPPILAPDEVEDLLLIRPEFEVSRVRALPLHVRAHEAVALGSLYIPRSEMVDIEAEISLLLRGGYVRRNPVLAKTRQDIATVRHRWRSSSKATRERLDAQGASESPLPPCFVVTGLSGTGKSRGIRAILALYPQVILHSLYEHKRLRETQITWISVDAPINGSVQGFLLRMFAAVDRALGIQGGPASYVQQFGRAKVSIDQKIEELAQIAATYHIGLLHIDDLQRLAEVHSSKATQVLNVIIQLANVVRVPLVLSGTPKMAEILATSLEAARRTSSAGGQDLSLPESAQDPHFCTMMQALESFQWLDQAVVIDGAWRQKLFAYSRGLPAILISLFTNAQKYAARRGAKVLTMAHIDMAYQKNCELIHPALEALRSNNPTRFGDYEDLQPTRVQIMNVLRRNREAMLVS